MPKSMAVIILACKNVKKSVVKPPSNPAIGIRGPIRALRE